MLQLHVSVVADYDTHYKYAHLTGGVGRVGVTSSARSRSTQGANTCAGSPAHHSRSSLSTCSVWIGLDWIGLDWIGLDWIGLNWIGLVWIELQWIGLGWVGLGPQGLEQRGQQLLKFLKPFQYHLHPPTPYTPYPQPPHTQPTLIPTPTLTCIAPPQRPHPAGIVRQHAAE